MPTPVKPSSLCSPDYESLSRWFCTIEPPFSDEDVRQFSHIYRRIYPTLNRHERRKAEWLVDVMISQLEQPGSATLIFGVV